MADPLDPTPEPGFRAIDFIAHLWLRRWFILGVSAAVFVISYLTIRVFIGEQFETRALIYVRPQPKMDIEDRNPGIPSPAFNSMFTSDHAIEFVRNQYNEGFAGKDDHKRIEAPLEKYRFWFSAKTVTLIDTTVSMSYSPVIELRVRGGSRGQALALMNLWVNHIQNKYGNLISDEAGYLAKSARERTAELKDQLAVVAEEQGRLDAESKFVDARMASSLRGLTRASFLQTPASTNETLPWNLDPGPIRTNVMIEQAPLANEPGLYELRTQLAVEIAKAEAMGSDGELDQLKAELAAVESMIPRLEEQVESLRERAAELGASKASVAAEVSRLEYAIKLNNSVASQAEASMRATADEGPEQYSTLRLLSEPVVPTLRVFPKRTIMAGGIGAAAFALLIVIFCLEHYIREALRIDAERRGLA